MDRNVTIQLNGNRKITGVIRGFDAFMNVVVDDAVEEKPSVRVPMGLSMIRGNSIVMIEAMERVVCVKPYPVTL